MQFFLFISKMMSETMKPQPINAQIQIFVGIIKFNLIHNLCLFHTLNKYISKTFLVQTLYNSLHLTKTIGAHVVNVPRVDNDFVTKFLFVGTAFSIGDLLLVGFTLWPVDTGLEGDTWHLTGDFVSHGLFASHRFDQLQFHSNEGTDFCEFLHSCWRIFA